MRRISVLIFVLSITVCANAATFISVADEDKNLTPNETTIISIWRFDYLNPPWGEGYYFGLTAESAGTLNIDNVMPPFPEPPFTIQIWNPIEIPGMKDPILSISFPDVPPEPPPDIQGKLVDNIILHCDGIGDVTMLLFDQNLNIVDSQVVHQVPEPISMALLGLGAMMLRRRR